MTDPHTQAELDLALCAVEAERIGRTLAAFHQTLTNQGISAARASHLVNEANSTLWNAYCYELYGYDQAAVDGDA